MDGRKILWKTRRGGSECFGAVPQSHMRSDVYEGLLYGTNGLSLMRHYRGRKWERWHAKDRYLQWLVWLLTLRTGDEREVKHSAKNRCLYMLLCMREVMTNPCWSGRFSTAWSTLLMSCFSVAYLRCILLLLISIIPHVLKGFWMESSLIRGEEFFFFSPEVTEHLCFL